jgi:hypothetical protein
MKMKHVNLLAGGYPTSSLDDFAASFYKIAGVSKFEERESSNYVDGRYFTAALGERIFKVMLSDAENLRDLPYWVRVSAAEGAEPLTAVEVDALAQKLVHSGYKVARITDFGQNTEKRFDYLRET